MHNYKSKGWIVAALLALSFVGCGKDEKPAGTTEKDLTPNGLGAVCTTSADCEGELECHQDTADTTSNQLCSAPCGVAADCHSQFAEYTTCTGVHTCVVTCETDDDCVEGTTCDSHGWCQRGGTGSGVQVCEGTVAACSTVATQTACEAARCTWSGTCSGTPTACSTAMTMNTCQQMAECQWYDSTSQCDGTRTLCSRYQTAEACISHDGDCPATPVDCASLATLEACQAVSGCSWSDDGGAECTGTPIATACSGCAWASSCTGESAIATCEAAGVANCDTTPGCRLVTQ